MGRSCSANRKKRHVVVRYWILDKGWELFIANRISLRDSWIMYSAPSSSLAEQFVRFSGIHGNPDARLINSGMLRKLAIARLSTFCPADVPMKLSRHPY
jgi:hypothetical protein